MNRSSYLGMALESPKNTQQQVADILEEDEQQIADSLLEDEMKDGNCFLLDIVDTIGFPDLTRMKDGNCFLLDIVDTIGFPDLTRMKAENWFIFDLFDTRGFLDLTRSFVPSEPEFTPKEKRNLILERIAFLENDQRLTAKEKRCKDQIVKDEVTSSQYDYFGRQTARIIDDVNAATNEIRPMHQRANETLSDTSSQNNFSKRPTASIKDGVILYQDEIRGNNQIPDANRIAKQKICIEETAGRMIGVVNALADEIRRKVIIGTEGIQMELDIIRMSTANLKDTVTALIEEIRQEHHIVDDGDIAEELGYIQWIIAELMGALKGLKTEMRENQLDLQSVGIKRKLNTVAIKREVSGDDAHQRFKKTKHIATYDLAGEKKPTYGNLSAVLCELCINENEAVNWCETCNANICVSCTCFHKDVRMMINHRIFNLP